MDIHATKMKIEQPGPKHKSRASNKPQALEPEAVGAASSSVPPTAAPPNERGPEDKEGYKSLPTQNFDFDQHINKVSSLGKISSN